MRCAYCGEQIPEEATYYDVENETVCESCISDWLENHEWICHETPEPPEDVDPSFEPEYWEGR